MFEYISKRGGLDDRSFYLGSFVEKYDQFAHSMKDEGYWKGRILPQKIFLS